MAEDSLVTLVGLASLVKLILHIVIGVMFLRWVHRTHSNLPGLGARYLRVSPRWAEIACLVPVVNFFAPYTAMRDLARVSRSPVRWNLEDTPPSMIFWWTLRVRVLLIDNTAIHLQMRPDTLVTRHAIAVDEVIVNVLSVPLHLLLRHIVRSIWRDQAQHRAQQLAATAA